MAAVFNIESGEIRTMLRKFDDLHPFQSGLGSIVGLDPGGEHIFMPAFVGRRPARLHLLRANLNTGQAKIYARGNEDTLDWFVDDAGNVLAREEFDNAANQHIVRSKVSGKWKIIFAEKTPLPNLNFVGVSSDYRSLVYTSENNPQHDGTLFRMNLEDGTTGPLRLAPLQQNPDSQNEPGQVRDIDRILTQNLKRAVLGVQLSGLMPKYEFADLAIQKAMDRVSTLVDGNSVYLSSNTDDWSKILFMVSGPDFANQHLLYDADDSSLKLIGVGYDAIAKEHIGQVTAIRYPARDGLKIAAILTWPVGVEDRTKLPVLVLPHGGPESYDRVRFYWWAQYFARKGYLVLQPNFRGSTGRGVKFRDAGRGEWGRKMQDDISDGVQTLVTTGHADPERVCIMGASYGGYAALAGGAFTPERYQCVISIAGVADLSRMIHDTRFKRRGSHWVVNYWQKLIGDSRRERDKLEAISPVNSAADFEAPVLLLHGKDDTVVPFRQSRLMQKVLKKAGKSVELIPLKGEDHWLSRSQTRVAMLTAIDEFLETHNPPG